MRKAAFKGIGKIALRLWNVIRQHFGLPMVYVGVLMMAVGYFTRMTDHNWYLGLSLFMVLGGGIIHIISLKSPLQS